ncbi:MAG TPA: uracil-DNA glycosylase [Candidatus Limiplasma sp.]|nr:uracil-DNA glycosylase [Candidatus Limiplasma sp.]HPS81041.1 uracil-DNA glycosylase [Candidatus Limiplasma sp.]
MARDTLQALERDCRACFANLWNRPTTGLVFGDGNTASPRLMLIGEAPGEQEAIQGKPFVGKAGKNLSEFLQSISLSRSELYISNVVKFRPSRLSAAGRTVNRPPTREEIGLFLPWLYREILLVQPKGIVTLGNVALHALIPAPATIGECHGRWHAAEIASNTGAVARFPHFALYHPASVIYNRALEAVYREDLQTLKRSLESNGGQMDS